MELPAFLHTHLDILCWSCHQLPAVVVTTHLKTFIVPSVGPPERRSCVIPSLLFFSFCIRPVHPSKKSTKSLLVSLHGDVVVFFFFFGLLLMVALSLSHECRVNLLVRRLHVPCSDVPAFICVSSTEGIPVYEDHKQMFCWLLCCNTHQKQLPNISPWGERLRTIAGKCFSLSALQPVGRAFAVVQPASERPVLSAEPVKSTEEQVEIIKVG